MSLVNILVGFFFIEIHSKEHSLMNFDVYTFT